MLCLDPSAFAGPWIDGLGGFVAISATLSPVDFYRDLLGLEPELARYHRVAGVFPADNRRVLVNPSISTAWKDRSRDADATADALQSAMDAVPGNVAVFFSSFAMARDISSRWSLQDRRVLLQESSMAGEQRQQWLDMLGAGKERFVLVLSLIHI